MQQIAPTDSVIPSLLAPFASLSNTASQRKDDIDFVYTLWGHPHFEADFSLGSSTEASLSTSTPTSARTPNHFESSSTGNSTPPHSPTLSILNLSEDITREIASMFTLSPAPSSFDPAEQLRAILESAPQLVVESPPTAAQHAEYDYRAKPMDYPTVDQTATNEVTEAEGERTSDDAVNLVLTALLNLLQQEASQSLAESAPEEMSAEAIGFDEAEYARNLAQVRLEGILRQTEFKHMNAQNVIPHQQLLPSQQAPAAFAHAKATANTYPHPPSVYGYQPSTHRSTQISVPQQHPHSQPMRLPTPQAQQLAQSYIHHQEHATVAPSYAQHIKRTHRPSPHAPPSGVPLPVYPVHSSLLTQPSTHNQGQQQQQHTGVPSMPPTPFTNMGRIPANHVVPSFQSLFMPNGAEPIVPVAPATQQNAASHYFQRKSSGSSDGSAADLKMMQPKVVPPLPISALTAIRKPSSRHQAATPAPKKAH